MVLHNPNNWHWVNKDASSWAKEYLDKELVGLSAEENGVAAKIDKILSMDGDVDVSQRKGKVITLFDVKLRLEYSGTTKDEDEVSGTINVPEVAHDTEEDEYVFEIDIYAETPAKLPVKDLVRTQLTPLLRTRLATLGPTLIASHAKDLQHAAGADPSTGFSTTPKYTSSSSVAKSSDKAPAAAADSDTGTKSTVNVTTVTASDEFRTSAEELYTTFTDPQRLAAFTRSPPEPFAPAKEGAPFSLFGGNVSGTYVALQPPTGITQRWRLASWPKGHYSTLRLKFDQNDVDAVTVMRVEWEGVPVGQEEVTRRNWGEYYVRSLKTTFGFGTVL